MAAMRRWWGDTLFTAAFVAAAAALPAVLPGDMVGHAHLLFALLAVVLAAARGGLVQGLLATVLGFSLQVGLYGDVTWLIPGENGHAFLETVTFLVEGTLISLLAHFNALGHLSIDRLSAFQTLFETIPVGLLLHDGHKIRAVNAAGAKLFGFSAAELVGVTPLKILTQDSLSGIAHHARLGHLDPFLGSGLRKGGETFAVEFASGTLVVDRQSLQLTAVRAAGREPAPETSLATEPVRYPSAPSDSRVRELERRVNEQAAELAATAAELRMAREQVQTLVRLLPLCAQCGKFDLDEEERAQLTAYLHELETEGVVDSLEELFGEAWLCGECRSQPTSSGKGNLPAPVFGRGDLHG